MKAKDLDFDKERFLKFKTEKRLNKLIDVLSKRQKDLSVILENINDPHNMSAALRSCDAVGIMNVKMIYNGRQPIPKIGKTSSASAKKWVEKELFNSAEDCFERVRSTGKKIYTTHMSSGAVSLYDLDLTEPVALMFGNEHSGISEEALEMADGNFLIPQIGMIQSLNISVAVAVSVFEAFRQRLKAGMYDDIQFEENEFLNKLDEWVRK